MGMRRTLERSSRRGRLRRAWAAREQRNGKAGVAVGHDEIAQDRLYYFEAHEIVVPDFDASGYILDLGGGGEGVIGTLKTGQVVAIDPNRRELEDAPAGPLKIIMDARALRFLDSTFSAATSFFTLMYIPGSDHEKVFGEVFRVLKTGAPFFIWDVAFPSRLDSERDIAVIPLTVKLPTVNIETGYGTRWPDKEQGLNHYRRLAESSGFDVLGAEETGRVLFLHLQKPG